MATDLEYYQDPEWPIWHLKAHIPEEPDSLETLNGYIDSFLRLEEKHWRECTDSCNTVQRCGNFTLLSEILSGKTRKAKVVKE